MEYLKKLEFRTTCRYDVLSLTDQVNNFLHESGIQTGLCVVHSPSVTSGLTITSFWDPLGLDDLQDEIDRIVPTRIDFKHQHDTPSDAAAHVKTSIVGTTLTLIITKGELILGHSQGIFYMEFDGPRNREYFIKLISED